MKDSLQGKIVLLTGASSGIGWATALELSRRGCRLAVAARRKDKLQELADLLPEDTLTLPWDVSDTQRAPELIALVLERFGRLDILINNAGVMSTKRFHEQDMAEVESVLQTNFFGAAALTRSVLPSMLARRDGHIVNIASMAGVLGFPFMAAYAASKFALVGFTESLRREYRGTGVTLTSFCPGSVPTAMTAASFADEKLSRLARPKTTAQMARRIADCCRERSPEVLYGDAPGLVLRFAQWFPRLTDHLMHLIYTQAHPLGRKVV
ncbi:MAG: SDR family NAD(P)-dependent oxidoreductase [Elusimicrobiota bacterium]|mgnify:CR=1 FL=1